jgi:large subunit ribosomal protein L5
MKLQQLYKEKAIPALKEKFQYENVNQVPKLVKIVVSIGMEKLKTILRLWMLQLQILLL